MMLRRTFAALIFSVLAAASGAAEPVSRLDDLPTSYWDKSTFISGCKSGRYIELDVPADDLDQFACPQCPRDGHQHEEDHAGRAQMALARYIILPVRIDERGDIGKLFVGLMVIDNDAVGLKALGNRQRLETGRAAIDRHDQLGAFLDQRLDGRRVRTVAFEDAVRDVDARPRAVMFEIARKQCR